MNDNININGTVAQWSWPRSCKHRLSSLMFVRSNAHPCTVENLSSWLWGCLTYPPVFQISLSNKYVIQWVVCYHNKHPYVTQLIILVYNQHIYVLASKMLVTTIGCCTVFFFFSCVKLYECCYSLIIRIKSQMFYFSYFVFLLFCVLWTS